MKTSRIDLCDLTQGLQPVEFDEDQVAGGELYEFPGAYTQRFGIDPGGDEINLRPNWLARLR